MPTILKVDGWRFFFFSNDHSPAHVHFEKGDKAGKILIESGEIVESWNLTTKEEKLIRKIVRKNRKTLLEEWERIFG